MDYKYSKELAVAYAEQAYRPLITGETIMEKMSKDIAEKYDTVIEDTLTLASAEYTMSTGFKVDKERLIKALSHDKSSYEQGFVDGWKKAEALWVHVKDELPPPENGENSYDHFYCVVKNEDGWDDAMIECHFNRDFQQFEKWDSKEQMYKQEPNVEFWFRYPVPYQPEEE